MNSNTLRTVGLYFTGALFGGLVGAVIGSLIVDQILLNENGPLPQEDEEEAAEEESEETPIRLEKVKKKRNETKIDFTKYSKTDDGKSAEKLNELVKKYATRDEEETPIDPDGPHIISIDEYSEGYHNNSNVTLTYYELDDVVAEPDDSILDNVDKTIGEDTLLKFGEGSEDKDIVYVRNNRISTDFEIIRVHKSYSETVIGTTEKKQTKKVKKKDDEE